MPYNIQMTSQRFLALCLSCAAIGAAQTPAVLVKGLLNPSKILLTPGGNLLVTETGSTPNSGRVSFVDQSGNRHTLIDGLPSGLSAPNNDADGPNGLALSGNTLYVAIGEGDTMINGTAANTVLPNSKGPSSPIFASILKLTLPAGIDSVTGSYTLASQDQYTLADGNTVTLKDAAGNALAVDMLTMFRETQPDPVTIYRNSHPYGITLHPSHPDSLYAVNAGLNTVVEISLSTGRAHTLAHIPNFPNHAPGPPSSEAVPDSIRPYGDQLLVSLLTGFPFNAGASQVVLLDPATGKSTPFMVLLSSSIDAIAVPRDPRALFFSLEYSTNLLGGAPGRVTRYDTSQGQVLANNLNGPTNLAYDAASGTLYISLRGDGSIVKITGQ